MLRWINFDSVNLKVNNDRIAWEVLTVCRPISHTAQILTHIGAVSFSQQESNNCAFCFPVSSTGYISKTKKK